MILPNQGSAVIAPTKLRDYLLSMSSERGRGKAVFFARLGYTDANWEELDADLRSQILPMDAEEVEANQYVRKFVIRGRLKGPSGLEASIVSLWGIDRGKDFPRLLTAYPDKAR